MSTTIRGSDNLDSSKIQKLLTSNLTVTVGSTGDFPTINSALDYLQYFKPLDGVNATITLKAGFVMAEQVFVIRQDLGWITIQGEDAQTTIRRSALTNVPEGTTSRPAFYANNGCLPTIKQLFNMDTTGVSGSTGIQLYYNSFAFITSGKGVKNAGASGLLVNNNSKAYANGADFSYASDHGVVADNTSSITFMNGNASYAGRSGTGSGIYATNGSIIQAELANASNAATHGVTATSGSTIHFGTGNASYCASYGVYALHGSTIDAPSAIATNCLKGFYAYIGSKINAYDTDASNSSENGYRAEQASQLNAVSGIASNSGSYGVLSYMSSNVNFRQGTALNTNSYSVRSDAAHLDASFSNCTAVSTTNEYSVVNGGILIRTSATGDTATTQALTTPTASGIIF
jgi:hypothetical protein